MIEETCWVVARIQLEHIHQFFLQRMPELDMLLLRKFAYVSCHSFTGVPGSEFI